MQFLGILFYAIVGGLCAQYVIKYWLKRDIPIWVAGILGVCFGVFAIGAAVVTFLIGTLGKPASKFKRLVDGVKTRLQSGVSNSAHSSTCFRAWSTVEWSRPAKMRPVSFVVMPMCLSIIHMAACRAATIMG